MQVFNQEKKFTGQAEYIGDLPDLPNQLYAAFVTAEASPGSVIQSTDATEALVNSFQQINSSFHTLVNNK